MPVKKKKKKSKLYLKNRSNYYIKKKKNMDRYLENKLECELNQRKLEFQYECIVKMGEANDLQKFLKGSTRYNGYKNPVSHKILIFVKIS